MLLIVVVVVVGRWLVAQCNDVVAMSVVDQWFAVVGMSWFVVDNQW
jgi:hypothetical protein